MDRRTRTARTLIGTGATALVFGGLVAAGCVAKPDHGNGCTGGPHDANAAAGIPIMALGAGLVVTGWLLKPRAARPLLPPPGAPPPAPDPFTTLEAP